MTPDETDKPRAAQVHAATWTWREPKRGEHFRRCAYCGCIHPADLAQEIERGGVRPEWADQKYGWPHKFYVHVPNRDPDAIFCVGSLHEAKAGPFAPGGERYTPPRPGYVAWDDLTPEQLEIARRDGMAADRSDYLMFGTRPDHFGKFYTCHLADPAVAEWKPIIERWSGLRFEFEDGTVRWGPA